MELSDLTREERVALAALMELVVESNATVSDDELKEVQHVVNADILAKLGANGTIVNIARGSVIDQTALVAALESNVIAGAGLDVYEKEPHAPDALTKCPNVVLTPHIGGHTVESHIGMQDCVLANLAAFFAGKPLRYPVA